LFAQQITNIHVTQEVDNVVITYDLTGEQPGETFNIEVTVSDNSGQSFLIIPKSLSGDLMDVSIGNNKKIIWEVLKDKEELTGEGFVFKLNAKSNKPINNFSTAAGTFTDERDGEVYKWVKIGTQIWMAENLRATKYNDGAAIPNVTEKSDWYKLKTDAYCWYENDIINKISYGALYNWHSVNTGKLCPTGWHVPSDSEWTTLTDYLGGEGVVGGILRETGTTYWSYPNTGATNTSGFSALPGGSRIKYGNFYGIGSSGDWWSSSEGAISDAWNRSLYFRYKPVGRSYKVKEFGLSVRCIRDN